MEIHATDATLPTAAGRRRGRVLLGGLVYAHNLVPARRWVAMAEQQAIQVSNTPSGVAPKAVFETRLPFTAKLYMAGLKSGAGEVYELTSKRDGDWPFADHFELSVDVPRVRRSADRGELRQRDQTASSARWALTNLVSSTLVPQAFVACVARSHLVLGNTYESATSYVQRVRWSARDDASDFDPSDATRSNYVDLTDNLDDCGPRGRGQRHSLQDGRNPTARVHGRNHLLAAVHAGKEHRMRRNEVDRALARRPVLLLRQRLLGVKANGEVKERKATATTAAGANR